VRQAEVSETPEERVRHRLLLNMIGPLGYPRGHLAVEKNLFSFGLQRRVDLVCFYPVKDLLKPLLLVECKAVVLTTEAENQLFGYNLQIGAPFLCLVNDAEIKTIWQEQNSMRSISFLPSYSQLIEKVC
jgi:hypothetical protein